ncbi:YoaK family protein, partial [Streptomyces sp. 1222.5]|uniref:YoaK family protein n=1 Tax=Streptomyces sp. 1222.5 TaxID=1881026 RepID=UPI003EBF0105
MTAELAMLTLLSGAVDAVTFLSMGHIFAALETGNLLFLAFSLTGTSATPLAGPAVAFACFVAGAAGGAAFTHWLAKRHAVHWFSIALVGEFSILAGTGFLVIMRHGGGSLETADLQATALVALAMGLQGAAIMRRAVPGMPTLLIQMSLLRLVQDTVAE